MTPPLKRKHTPKERQNIIYSLVSDGNIGNKEILLNKLDVLDIKISMSTLENDLHKLNIRYNKDTSCYTFSNSDSNFTSNLSIRDSLYSCGLDDLEIYAITPPLLFASSKSCNKDNDFIFKLFVIYIQCKDYYEEILYSTIKSNFTSYNIFTIQVNRGSVAFLFSSLNECKRFYDDLHKKIKY